MCCDMMMAFSAVVWSTMTPPSPRYLVTEQQAVKLKSESGTMSLANVKDVSAECFSRVYLLLFLQSSRRIFTACSSAWYLSSMCLSAFSHPSFSRASHMKPEPHVWLRTKIREPKCCCSFHFSVICWYWSGVWHQAPSEFLCTGQVVISLWIPICHGKREPPDLFHKVTECNIIQVQPWLSWRNTLSLEVVHA